MSQLFFFTLVCVVGLVASGPINGPCCLKKTVGNVSYTHVGETDTSRYACLSNCVYEQDGVTGSRFCFAQGELLVVCNGIGIEETSWIGLYCTEEDREAAFGKLTGPTEGLCCHPNGTATEITCSQAGCLPHCADADCLKIVDQNEKLE